MNQYITGAFIKKLREEKNMTQLNLANKLGVSDKAISKWETGKGYPDISLLEPLSEALGVSLIELMSGSSITNKNKSFNMNNVVFYVCPVCGNIIVSIGETVVSCCGIVLPPQEVEENLDSVINISIVEDEYYIEISHDMQKNHYITFIASVRDNGIELVKLYPEGSANARFKTSRTRYIYYYCNRHGLSKIDMRKYKLKANKQED